MYFKLQLGQKNGEVLYPVPIDALKNTKYRKDMLRCVCELDYDASSETGVEQITKEEYDNYPNCSIFVDKTQIQNDGVDVVTVKANLPVNVANECIKLIDTNTGNSSDLTLDFADSDSNGQATFQLTSTQSGKVFRLVAESDKFTKSEEVLIKVS